jgi:hypothetical protein
MLVWSASHCIYSPNRHSDAVTRAAGRHRNEWGDIDNRLKTLFDALRVPGVPQEIASNTRTSSANEPSLHPTGGRALIARINVETDRALGRAGSQSSAAHNPGEHPCQSSDLVNPVLLS